MVNRQAEQNRDGISSGVMVRGVEGREKHRAGGLSVERKARGHVVSDDTPQQTAPLPGHRSHRQPPLLRWGGRVGLSKCLALRQFTLVENMDGLFDPSFSERSSQSRQKPCQDVIAFSHHSPERISHLLAAARVTTGNGPCFVPLCGWFWRNTSTAGSRCPKYLTTPSPNLSDPKLVPSVCRPVYVRASPSSPSAAERNIKLTEIGLAAHHEPKTIQHREGQSLP